MQKLINQGNNLSGTVNIITPPPPKKIKNSPKKFKLKYFRVNLESNKHSLCFAVKTKVVYMIQSMYVFDPLSFA